MASESEIQNWLHNDGWVVAVEEDGKMCLHLAAQQHTCSQVLRILLEHGFPVTAVDNLGKTPLHYAACNPSVEIIGTLLEHGAPVSAEDKDGSQPLHYAARYNKNPEVIEMLLSHGACAYAANSCGHTPLYEAIAEGNTIQVIELLIEAVASLCK